MGDNITYFSAGVGTIATVTIILISMVSIADHTILFCMCFCFLMVTIGGTTIFALVKKFYSTHILKRISESSGGVEA